MQERTQIFDHLKSRQRFRRCRDVHNPPMLHLAAVRHTNDAAGGDRVRIVEERLHDGQQCVGLDQRVGVEHGDERGARHVQSGVERVRFAAAVLLVDHHQPDGTARFVNRADGGARKRAGWLAARFVEVKFIDQDLQRVVGRAVVHDDHFVLGVMQREHGPHALADARAFIVRRRQQGNGRHQRRSEHRVALGSRQAARLHAKRKIAERHQEQVDGVDGGDINNDEPLQAGECM